MIINAMLKIKDPVSEKEYKDGLVKSNMSEQDFADCVTKEILNALEPISDMGSAIEIEKLDVGFSD